jgi:DNA-binding NtrC family response regulator
MFMKNVLVVDDEESVRIILKQMLDKGGYGVGLASNGVEALNKMKSTKFDMLISDINMPVMDGVALLQKSKELYPAIPVIFITAYGKDKVIMEAMKAGLSDYIEKPFRMDEVLQTIREHIK